MNNDLTENIQQSVLQAIQSRTLLQIQGGNSKKFIGRKVSGKILRLNRHQGIINYQPTELVMTARTGTPVELIKQTLAAHGQMLAFEPPQFTESTTLGGAIACGLSGSRRPFAGSVRDFVLGCKIINGKGEVLHFGGEVMKNVAGYDVSRLMVGAMGTLGILLEVSLKVLPLPAAEQTCVFEAKPDVVLQLMCDLSLQNFPVSGLSYDGSLLFVRLSGVQQAVQAALRKLGGNELGNQNYWQQLRDQQLSFFNTKKNLWRISTAPAESELDLPGQWYHDWAGALRWLISDENPSRIFSMCRNKGVHAMLFRGRDNDKKDVIQPLSSGLKSLQRRLKQAFDPMFLFNPYRLFREW